MTFTSTALSRSGPLVGSISDRLPERCAEVAVPGAELP
jgi:hypothetical protein